MTDKKIQEEFIRKICRGRAMMVTGLSSLIHGYGKECNTSNLTITCYRNYDLELHMKNFAEEHGKMMEIVKDTPTSLHVYFHRVLLVQVKLATDHFVNPFTEMKKSDVRYQHIDSIFTNLISLYSYCEDERSREAIEWILNKHRTKISDASMEMAKLFASQKGWESLKELLNE